MSNSKLKLSALVLASALAFGGTVAAQAPQAADKVQAAVEDLADWLVCLRPAYVSLGLVGAVLLAALLATAVWMLIDYHVIDGTGRVALVWIGLAIAGIVLGMGLSWSLIRARSIPTHCCRRC